MAGVCGLRSAKKATDKNNSIPVAYTISLSFPFFLLLWKSFDTGETFPVLRENMNFDFSFKPK